MNAFELYSVSWDGAAAGCAMPYAGGSATPDEGTMLCLSILSYSRLDARDKARLWCKHHHSWDLPPYLSVHLRNRMVRCDDRLGALHSEPCLTKLWLVKWTRDSHLQGRYKFQLYFAAHDQQQLGSLFLEYSNGNEYKFTSRMCDGAVVV